MGRLAVLDRCDGAKLGGVRELRILVGPFDAMRIDDDPRGPPAVSQEYLDDEELTKTITVKETSWERLNEVQAIWTRKPQSVTKEEYHSFWKEVSKTDQEPLGYAHFEASGTDVEFKALMFIPPTAPYNFYDEFYSRTADVKLYVRRVFITDDFEDILPNYLM